MSKLASLRRQRTASIVRMLRAVGGVKRRRRVPKSRPPRAVERAYGTEIAGLVDQLHAAIEREIVPQLDGWVRAAAAREDALREDAGLGQTIRAFITRVANRLLGAIQPSALEALATKFADRTQAWNKAELKRQAVAAVGVDVFSLDPDLTPLIGDFVAENVALIRTVPQRYMEQVEGTVLRGVSNGTLARDIAAEITENTEVARRRAQLIARDQVGKFYGQVAKARQQKLGSETYIWATVKDNRVRPEHEDREGVEYAWTPEAAERLGVEYLPPDEQPGQPPLCRCSPEPSFDRLLEGL